MLLLVASALATDLDSTVRPALSRESVGQADHPFVGAVIDRRGACSDPAALDRVLAQLAADERAQLKDFEVGSPALPRTEMTLDVQSADVHALFRLLAERGDINIVAADGVQGEVSLMLHDMAWDEVLQVILASAHLDAVVGDNVIVVYPL
ncbi:MAG: hypothetical protein GY884_36185 [Proteobacteria bacterium]|nr:hypothetical protein [Pseudomonadota bacterium]